MYLTRLCFLLVLFPGLILTKKSSKKSDGVVFERSMDLDKYLKMNEEDVEALLSKMDVGLFDELSKSAFPSENGENSEYFGLNVQKMKDMLLNPQKVFDKYSELDPELLMRKMGLDNLQELTETYRVSESLEFIVDHYTRAVNTEEKLDTLITKLEQAKDNQRRHQTAKDTRKLKLLIPRAEELIDDARLGRINKAELGTKLKKLHKAQEDIGKGLGDETDDQKSTDMIRELEEERKMATEEVNKFSAMKDLYAKHMTKVYTAIQLDVGGEMNLADIPFNGEKIEFDINILKDLLKLYQRLEGLKNNILTEKDPERKVEMAEEIETLEDSLIPKMTTENQHDLQNLLTSTMGRSIRCLRKLVSADMLYKKLVESMGEGNEELRGLIKYWQTYKDLMEDAAKIWFEMKTKTPNDEL